MRDIRRLGVVVDPKRELPRVGRDRYMRENSFAREPGEPRIDHGNKYAVRVGNPIGASR
jgi:hypothetical protein